MQRTAYRIKRLRTSASELSACTTFETNVRAAVAVFVIAAATTLFSQWHFVISVHSFVHTKGIVIYSSALCKLLSVAHSFNLFHSYYINR